MKTTRNATQICLLIAMLLLPAVAQAQYYYNYTNSYGIWHYTPINGPVTITGVANIPVNGVVVIPDTINSYPVTTVGANAFQYSSVTSVTIGTNVTSIGDAAFENCSGLTSVTIPNSVASIGENAFVDCSGLTNVTIGTNVTSIGDAAFAYCLGLTSVTISDSVTSIGDRAFLGCSGLTSVTIPDSVTNIGEGAFEQCLRLTSVTIPDSVTSIGDYPFADCLRLTNIDVNAGNASYTSAGGVLFNIAKTTLVEYPGSLVGSYAIPNSVTSIGSFAFEDCINLTGVTIGNSVTSIGDGAFAYCSGLHQAFFQGNAPSVGGGAGSADGTVFSGELGTAYYLPGTTGWGATFGGWPTALWYQPQPEILGSGNGLGVQSSGFGFTISWATNISVVVEAATNLANPVWVLVSTNTLTSGTNYFSDPQWTNYPGRYYRLSTP